MKAGPPQEMYFTSTESFDRWYGVMSIEFTEMYDNQGMNPTYEERLKDVREIYAWARSQMKPAVWDYAEPFMAQEVQRVKDRFG